MPPLPAASQPSRQISDPAARPQIVDLEVEQPFLQLLDLAFVTLLVDRTVDHLDLVQPRPLAHPVLPAGS